MLAQHVGVEIAGVHFSFAMSKREQRQIAPLQVLPCAVVEVYLLLLNLKGKRGASLCVQGRLQEDVLFVVALPDQRPAAQLPADQANDEIGVIGQALPEPEREFGAHLLSMPLPPCIRTNDEAHLSELRVRSVGKIPVTGGTQEWAGRGATERMAVEGVSNAARNAMRLIT